MSKRTRLSELVTPKTLEQASEKVSAVAYILPEHIKVFEFANPISRKQANMEATTKQSRRKQPPLNVEDNLSRSIRETLKRIRGISACNDFDLFATFTFNKDRQDMVKCRAKMSTWLKNQRKHNRELKWLIVAEFHGDGVSLHFHALLKNFTGKLVAAINPKTNKPLKKHGNPVYKIPSYRSGFTDAQKIDDNPVSQAVMTRYLTKYITKDMPAFPNKKRFWASDGFKRPTKVDISPDTYAGLEPTWELPNEWGRTLIFPKSSLPNLEQAG